MLNYLKIITLPFFAVSGIVIVWFFVKPIYDDTRSLNQVKKPQLESLVQREKDMQQRTEKLYAESSSENQSDMIMGVLPDSNETKGLITQIEHLVDNQKMTISSISISGQSTVDSERSGIMSQNGGESRRELTGNFEVRGSYSQFKQLLGEFKKLNRVLNISQIEIANTGSEDGGATGKYTLHFTAYWQPAVTPEDIRSGLESMESGQPNSPMPGIPIQGSPNSLNLPGSSNQIE